MKGETDMSFEFYEVDELESALRAQKIVAGLRKAQTEYFTLASEDEVGDYKDDAIRLWRLAGQYCPTIPWEDARLCPRIFSRQFWKEVADYSAELLPEEEEEEDASADITCACGKKWRYEDASTDGNVYCSCGRIFPA
jgi:hypothetical protein